MKDAKLTVLRSRRSFARARTRLRSLVRSTEAADARLKHRGWAFADQVTVSAGNFLTQIVLARFLSPPQYGVYAVLITTILFLNGIHAALLVLPTSLRCAKLDSTAARAAVSSAVSLTPGLGIVLCVPLVLAAIFLGRVDVAIPASFALVAWQMQETVRASMVSQLRHREAIRGDAVSYLGQCLLLALLASMSLLSLRAAFIVIGVTSVIASVIQLSQTGYLRPSLEDLFSFGQLSYPVGRWAAPAKIVSFFTVQSFPWALALGGGPRPAAFFQAIANVLNAGNPVLIGTGSLVMASMANSGTNVGLARARQHALFGSVLVAAWCLAVAAFPRIAIAAFYGHGSAYASAVTPIRIMALATVLETIALPISCIMSGLGNTLALLKMQSLGALAFLCSVYLILRIGLSGATLSLLAVQCSRVLYGLYYYHKLAANTPSSLSIAAIEHKGG